MSKPITPIQYDRIYDFATEFNLCYDEVCSFVRGESTLISGAELRRQQHAEIESLRAQLADVTKNYNTLLERTYAAKAQRVPDSKSPGMAVQALAGEIISALLADEEDGGYDLTAGMFGAAFSALVRRWAAAEWALSAAPAQPTEQPAKDCEWTNCPNRVGDVCCNEQQEAQGEPVAWSPRLDYPQYEKQRVWANGKPRQEDIDYWSTHGNGIDYAYANPQQASKPMTDEQIRALCKEVHGYGYMPSDIRTVRAVERFHKIGEKK